MSRYDEERSPSDIERDIERNRMAMRETVDALQLKLSPGRLIDQVVDYVRHGPVDFGHNLGTTIKNNPVPIALIGIGLSWMIMAGSRGQMGETRTRNLGYGDRHGGYGNDRHRSGSGLHESGAATGTYAAGSGSSGRAGSASLQGGDDDSESLKDRVTGMARDARDKASQIAGQASERMSGMAHEARDRVSGIAQDVGERASRFAHDSTDRLRHAADEARSYGAEAHDRLRHSGARARSSFNELMQERPLALGAVSLAIGAVLGALLPATRREDRLLGRARDDLVDRAAEFGREQLHAAEDVIRSTATSVREEAGRQDLGHAGDRLAEAAREEMRKAASVASTGIDTAAREVEERHLGIGGGHGKDEERGRDARREPSVAGQAGGSGTSSTTGGTGSRVPSPGGTGQASSSTGIGHAPSPGGAGHASSRGGATPADRASTPDAGSEAERRAGHGPSGGVKPSGGAGPGSF